MPQWLQHPATWIIAGVAVLTAIITIARWTASVDADRRNFKSFMDEIRNDIKQILGRLPPVAVTSSSPLGLTDLGRTISETIGAKALATELEPQIRERAAGKHAYEVQELCFDFVKDEYTPRDEVKHLILACASENGIDKEQVLRVIAVELRDRILADPN